MIDVVVDFVNTVEVIYLFLRALFHANQFNFFHKICGCVHCEERLKITTTTTTTTTDRIISHLL
jgi:hypothetical protein